MDTQNAVHATSLPENGITVDQLYEQAKAIRPDVDSVTHTEWMSGEDGRHHKFFAFTEDETFMSTTPEGLLADVLASAKVVAA